MHQKRGKSARASPSPHHTSLEEQTTRFIAQSFPALVLTGAKRGKTRSELVAQKHRAISRQENIMHSPPSVGLRWDFPPHPPESVQAGGRTLTSKPKFRALRPWAAKELR